VSPRLKRLSPGRHDRDLSNFRMLDDQLADPSVESSAITMTAIQHGKAA
jgi:hypothetical protein